MKLRDKVAVVTGGNSGIGLSIAEELKKEGAKIAIMGRNEKTLDEAASKLGSGTVIHQGDVTKFDDLDALYAKVDDKLGKIDTLVVNAGGLTAAPFDQVDEAIFDSMSDLNFKGAFFTIQKALPFLNDGASIILISSIAQSLGFPGMSVYGATKAAVRSLSRTLSAELAGRKIRVNTISPGPVETPIYGRIGVPEDQIDGMKDQFREKPLMKRFGEAREIGTVAVFLASSDSSFIVGEEIVVDGGIVNI
ncbi:3-oxoacyl-[acyl-carrier protein] reductase [hydrothermal vent metagenome]|uniref:3-oxoacyl-[acyl-carrier protein] reductase n=1 Tax=hydrothermal vent metagenome TaxID=652676 RepID=A0A3B1BSG5_9ZZZZ